MKSRAAVRQQHRLAAALVAPALAMLGLFTFYPLLGPLWLSLHGSVASLPARGEPFVGLGHYREHAASPVLWRSLGTALGFVAVSTALETVLGVRVGECLRPHSRRR